MMSKKNLTWVNNVDPLQKVLDHHITGRSSNEDQLTDWPHHQHIMEGARFSLPVVLRQGGNAVQILQLVSHVLHVLVAQLLLVFHFHSHTTSAPQDPQQVQSRRPKAEERERRGKRFSTAKKRKKRKKVSKMKIFKPIFHQICGSNLLWGSLSCNQTLQYHEIDMGSIDELWGGDDGCTRE